MALHHCTTSFYTYKAKTYKLVNTLPYCNDIARQPPQGGSSGLECAAMPVDLGQPGQWLPGTAQPGPAMPADPRGVPRQKGGLPSESHPTLRMLPPVSGTRVLSRTCVLPCVVV